MFNFDYYNPTRIIFGRDTIARLDTLIPAGSRVLVVYGGGSIKQNTVYDQVMRALRGFAVAEFSGIEANPQLATCERAVAAAGAHRADFLLAVGGGSVIDAVKLVAASAATPDVDAWDLVLDGTRVRAALPFGVVLTLPATGSEMNADSVISRAAPADKRNWSSPLVAPVFSVLDPSTGFSLPRRQVANGIVDSWVHVCEQYLTREGDSPLQDRFAEGILQTLLSEGPRALQFPEDYQARANLMWAATMALNGLIGSGVAQDWCTHRIGHELTALHGLDHAQSLAVTLPGVLTLRKQAKHAKLLGYARRVWGLHQGDEQVLVDEAIGRTILFFESLGVPTTLHDYGLGPEVAGQVAERIAEKAWLLGENQDIGPDEVRQILLMRAG